MELYEEYALLCVIKNVITVGLSKRNVIPAVATLDPLVCGTLN